MNGVPRNEGYVSNELTHFVGRKAATDDDRFSLLCKILRSGELRGGGVSSTGQGNIRLDFSHPLASNDLVAPETVCFCDIPLKYLSIHMGKYSRFGLAFTKVFMRTKGCNPVYYISMHSPCTDHRYPDDDARRKVKWGDFFDRAFREWYKDLPRTGDRIDPGKLRRIDNLILWYVLGHVKFFDSVLKKDDEKNYYMEREWRIVGSMCFNLADVARVIVPTDYAARFQAELPDFAEDRIRRV